MTTTTPTPAAEPAEATAEQPAAGSSTGPAASETPENPYAAPRQEATAPATQNNGFSIASLVLGLVSIPTGWFAAGILAIVFGYLARSREPQARTMSTWGIVLGFVGTFGWVIFALLGLVIAAPFALWGMTAGWGFGFFDLF